MVTWLQVVNHTILCGKMGIWSSPIFVIQSPTESTLFIIKGFKHRARKHQSPVPGGLTFLGRLVIKHFHIENFVMFSSLVFCFIIFFGWIYFRFRALKKAHNSFYSFYGNFKFLAS